MTNIAQQIDQVVIRDKELAFTVGGDESSESLIYQIRSLWAGLKRLYVEIEHSERLVKERTPKDVTIHCPIGVASDERCHDIDIPLVTCIFHWYAVSACNMVRTIGAMRQQTMNSFSASQYVSDVLPAVRPFRDKIAAHFAGATGNSKDVEAERQLSVFPSIGLKDERFVTTPLTLRIQRWAEISSSEHLTAWSLTEVHAQLQARYSGLDFPPMKGSHNELA